MRVRSLGYRTDLLVRRLAGSEVLARDGYLVVRTPQNPDFYWGNFVLVQRSIGSGGIDHWLCLFRAEFPDAAHVAIAVDGTGRPAATVAQRLPLGMNLEVSTVLTALSLRPPPSLGAPAVLGVLSTDEDWRQMRALRVDVDDGAGDGLNPARHLLFLTRRVEEARQLAGSGRAAFFGAFLEGRLVSSLGVVVGRTGLARYQNVETHPRHRRQGLASWLVHAAGRHALLALGARRLVIVADPDGPGVGLYRKLGFEDTEYQVALQVAPGNG